MSNLATAALTGLTTWKEFQLLLERPEIENGEHYELHDGVVVLVPPPHPRHLSVQMRLPELLRFVEELDLIVTQEFAYRPALNYQFWTADVAVLPRSVRNAMWSWTQYDVYAPPLVIEVLSPSNRREKISRQRVAAMSNGTREFWVIDADKQTVHVTTEDGVKLYNSADSIELTIAPGKRVAVSAIFDFK